MTYKYVSMRRITRGQAKVESQEEEKTAIWDIASLERLLVYTNRHYELINTEPYRSWLNERGGAHRVQEYIRVVLAPRLLKNHQVILQGMLDGERWNDVAQRLGYARSTYFDNRKVMVQVLTGLVNFAWDTGHTPTLCTHCAKILTRK